MKPTLSQAIHVVRGSRAVLKDEAIVQELKSKLMFSDFIDKVYASEIFPDRNPPEIVIAESMTENHDDIRDRNPSTEPRLSGEVIHARHLKFFMLDALFVSENIISTPTKSTAGEIAKILLDKNFIPVDANFDFIPLS